MSSISDFGFHTVQMEINSSCNMSCTFCAYPIRSVPKSNMSLDQIKGLLDQLKDDGSIKMVSFQHYSEPLLHKNLFDAIDYSRYHDNKELKCQVITNCLGLNEKRVNKILKHSPNYLRLSMHTLDEAIYIRTRGSELPFDIYRANIVNSLVTLITQKNMIDECRIDVACAPRMLKSSENKLRVIKGGIKQNNKNIEINTMIEDLIPQLQDFIKDICEGSFVKYDEQLFTTLVDDYIKTAASASVIYPFNEKVKLTVKRHIDGRRMFSNYPVKYGTCGTNSLGIFPDGRVVLCCLDSNGWTCIGNAFEKPIIQLLKENKKTIMQLRKGPKLPFKECEKCQGSGNYLGYLLSNVHGYISSNLDLSQHRYNSE